MRRALVALLALLPVTAHAKKDQSGRPEALIFATTFGLYEGVAASVLLSEHDVFDSGDEALGWGSLLTLTTTVGTYAVAAHVTDKYGVNEAEASLYDSSLFWAVLNGAGGGLALDADVDGMLWSTLASGWTGQAVGILLAANTDRTAGQVGLMNTTATWTGAEALLVLAVADPDGRYSLVGTIAADAGLALGLVLSQPSVLGRGISQERTRLLDLGALCGGLAAPAALFMVWGPEDHLREWYLSAVAVGIPAGIATAWYLTRDYDSPDEKGEAKQAVRDSRPVILPLIGGAF
jgi:hypothetical protein